MPAPKKSSAVKKPSAADLRKQTERKRVLALAKLADSNARCEKRDIPFGAPVVAPQYAAVEKYMKSRDVLKTLKCTEKQLRAFSRNDIPFSQLPKPTQLAIRAITSKSNYSKPWPRKTATILYTILCDRKKRSRKPATPKPDAAVADVTKLHESIVARDS